MIRQTVVLSKSGWSRWAVACVAAAAVAFVAVGCQGESSTAQRDRSDAVDRTAAKPAAAPSADRPERSVTMGSAIDLYATDSEAVDERPDSSDAPVGSEEAEGTQPSTSSTASEAVGSFLSGLARQFGDNSSPDTAAPDAPDDGETFETETAREDNGGLPGAGQVTGLAVVGLSSVLPVGSTSSLQVMATLVDGSTVEVTSDVRWRLSAPGVCIIVEGAPAELHAVAPGQVSLIAHFRSHETAPLLVVAIDPPSLSAGDWVDTAADNQLSVDASLFRIERMNGETCLTTDSAATNIHSHFVTTDSANWSSYSVTGRLQVDEADAGVGVTFLSQYPNEDRYYRLRRFGDGGFLIAPHGTSITGGDTESDVVPVPGASYEFLVQIADVDGRTEIRAKVWAAGTSEPQQFQIDCFDDSPTRLTEGTIGMWAMGAGTKTLFDLRLDGEALPLPIPNELEIVADDTSLALGQSAEFSVLARLQDDETFDVTDLASVAHGDRLQVTPGAVATVTRVDSGPDSIVATYAGVSATLPFETEGAHPQSIVIAESGGTMTVGANTALNVFALFSDGSSGNVTSDVTWEISDPAVLEVSNGNPAQLTAVGAGSASVTAHLDGLVSGSIVVDVSTVVSLVDLTITGPTAPLSAGETGELSVFANYSDGASVPVTDQVSWALTTPMRVYIEPGDPASLTALFGGTTTVTANFEGLSVSMQLEVVGPPPLTGLTVAAAQPSLQVGATTALAVTAQFSDGSTDDVTAQSSWSMTTTGVVSLQQGVITALAPGSTTITAHYQDQTATVTLSVLEPTVASLALTGPSAPLMVGDTAALHVIASYSNGSVADVTGQASFACNPASVLAVSGSTVTAVSAGQASITATFGGMTSNAVAIDVTSATLEGLTLQGPTNSLLLGEVFLLTVTAAYSDGATADVTDQVSWSTGVAGVVSIEAGSTAVLTAIGAGETPIFASIDGVTSNVVIVEVAAPSLESIALTASATQVELGDTVQMTATGNYSDGTTQDLTDSVNFIADYDAILSAQGGGLFVAATAGATQLMAVLADVDSNVIVVEVTEATLDDIVLQVSDTSLQPDGTAALTVLAQLSDGTQMNVTADSEFIVGDPSVLAVSPGSPAIATALSVGNSSVHATYEGMVSSQTVIQVAEASPIEVATWVDTMPGSLSEDDSLFGVGILSSQLVMQTESSETNIHSHLVTDESPSWSTYEFCGRMQIESPTGGVGVTFYSGFPNHDHYYRLRRYSDTDFFIAPHGTSITSGDTTSGVVPVPGVWYRFRVQVNDTGSETQILARVWQQGQSEPSGWQINCVDANGGRLTEGTIGCWSMGPGTKCWSDFEVNSQPIPLPQPFVMDLSAATDSLNVGESTSLNLTVTDPNGTSNVTSTATFEVSQPDLLSVDSSGNVTANAPGFVQVTANHEGYTSNVVTLLVFPDGDPTESGLASSVSQHGVTWIFDQNYQVGQFVNGDYWVVGPVSIVGMDPPCVQDGNRIRHGSMLNPVPQGANHGYDSSLYGSHAGNKYKPELNVGFNVNASNPLVLGPNNSLVTAVSKHATAFFPPGLQSAAVLTVLDAPPIEGSFRPPYSGSAKPLYNMAQLQTGLLGNLTAVGTMPSVDGLVAELQAPWIDHVHGWLSRFLHPEDNMPDYGRDMSMVIGKASLVVHCDIPLAQKMPLLVRLVQLGIDLDGLFQVGGNWNTSGGHTVGRKWPIMFKRAMFGEPTNLNVSQSVFSEDGQTFYVTQTSPGVYNHGYGGYGAAQNGMPEWGEYYWQQSPAGSDGFFDWFENSYRRCCTYNASGGHFLAAYVMGLRSDWNWEPAFDYMDRFMQIENGWTRQLDGWTGAMWDAHRASFGGYTTIPAGWFPP